MVTPLNTPQTNTQNAAGFTLIEISIVAVIIALIIGGALVGQELINAATIRSQISQIEKYQAAIRTFQAKYVELPGDIEANLVSQFGFTAAPNRTGTAGRGNGDGMINSYVYGSSNPIGWGFGGENLFFWADLSANSGLIEGSFNTVTDTGYNLNGNATFLPYLPIAKTGNSNYISVFTVNSINYFQIISPYKSISNSELDADPAMTVQQAYKIDTKMDDGIPTSGKVLASMSVSRDSKGHNNAGSVGTRKFSSCQCIISGSGIKHYML